MGRINRRLVARHLGNAAKTLNLLRVYFGARLHEPLPIEALARQMAEEEDCAADSARNERDARKETPPCRG